MLIITLTFLLFLVFSSGFFSSSETALFSLSNIKVRLYQKSSDPRKRLIAQLLSRPRDLLVTVFLLNTLVNIFVQNVTSSLFGIEASWLLKVGIPFIVLLMLGEIIPKYLGMELNEEFAYATAPTINFFQKILSPIQNLLIKITAPISRILFFYLQKEKNISKEELQHVLKKSEETGVLPKDETELVLGFLNLQNATVKEIMRPREDILYYNVEEPISKLNYLFVDQECTRIPVCKGDLENLLGIISAKEYFLHIHEIQNQKRDLLSLLEKPYFIPENAMARPLIKRFENVEAEIAIVVDEYRSISGLIAYEDLAEVVVGKITDYRDQTPIYSVAGKNEIIASGKMELTALNEHFETDLKSPNNLVTIGGWIIEYLGEIPKSGTNFEANGFIFQILAAEPNRIRRVYIRKLNNKKRKL
ncbi:Hemolysin C [Candidatus Rubidus massiliensis]|nr:MAG: hypothetical protein BGO10_08985 [Chlamydia sp. 32-24]CDZ81175.1 Hemolysin C [Candidatus Rubidus massiliensis]